MNIINRVLTLRRDIGSDTIECIAGCRVTLTAEELGDLGNPFHRHPGFTLTCELLAGDPGPDPIIFTYPGRRTFRTPTDIFDPDHVFRAPVSVSILNEDARGADEIKARFIFVNDDTGRSMTRKSNRVTIVL